MLTQGFWLQSRLVRPRVVMFCLKSLCSRHANSSQTGRSSNISIVIPEHYELSVCSLKISNVCFLYYWINSVKFLHLLIKHLCFNRFKMYFIKIFLYLFCILLINYVGSSIYYCDLIPCWLLVVLCRSRSCDLTVARSKTERRRNNYNMKAFPFWICLQVVGKSE